MAPYRVPKRFLKGPWKGPGTVPANKRLLAGTVIRPITTFMWQYISRKGLCINNISWGGGRGSGKNLSWGGWSKECRLNCILSNLVTCEWIIFLLILASNWELIILEIDLTNFQLWFGSCQTSSLSCFQNLQIHVLKASKNNIS